VRELLLTFDLGAVDVVAVLVVVVEDDFDVVGAAFSPACLARSLARRGFELFTEASLESSCCCDRDGGGVVELEVEASEGHACWFGYR